MTRCSTTKNILFCRLFTDALFALFMVISSLCEEPQPIYEGIYTVEGYDEGIYCPTRMITQEYVISLALQHEVGLGGLNTKTHLNTALTVT
jgi:hypothetical protein